MSRQRSSRRLVRWQLATLGLLVSGYSGYYLCRSHFSVTFEKIVADLAIAGYDPAEAKIQLGRIVSLGTLAYALGKFFSGGLGDFVGGRRNYLGGMLGAVLCTVAFAWGGTIPVFTVAWIGNRLVQSLGWVGMVKITSRWFSFATYGRAMGIISLSYLFGDAAARYLMGLLLQEGYSWRGVFYVAASILFAVFVVNLLLLKETPARLGLPEPHTDPRNLFGARGEEAVPVSLKSLLLPLARSPAFWLVCLLSLGVTLVRETFNTWTPAYFTEAVGLDAGLAGKCSALFPLMGGFSVLLCGYLSDRLGHGGRAMIIFHGLLLTTLTLAILGLVEFGRSQAGPVVVVGLIAFVMIGPYSFLAGALALDFGGKQGSATACGIIDGVGYLGAVLAGEGMARMSVAHGWERAFLVLAVVAGLATVAAGLFWLDQRRALRGQHSPT
jgi:OPA family glycerol-3-phosphate transporter-like MFS transporter